MFWHDGGNQAILRANADGSNVQTIVNTGADGTGLAVDFAAGKVYWSVVGSSAAIFRADLDGGNVETIISGGLSVPEGIALDTVNGKVYWADQGASKISPRKS
jgi:DNA-binding beta-propeller fold protein YncE